MSILGRTSMDSSLQEVITKDTSERRLMLFKLLKGSEASRKLTEILMDGRNLIWLASSLNRSQSSGLSSKLVNSSSSFSNSEQGDDSRLSLPSGCI